MLHYVLPLLINLMHLPLLENFLLKKKNPLTELKLLNSSVYEVYKLLN